MKLAHKLPGMLTGMLATVVSLAAYASKNAENTNDKDQC